MLLETFSPKGIVRDHLQLSDEFFYSLSFCFTSDLDCMGRYLFIYLLLLFFVALSIYRLIGFGFVLRARSPSADRFSLTKL